MKVSPVKSPDKVTFHTKPKVSSLQLGDWWKARSEAERGRQLLTTAAFLKESQAMRYRQAALYARLYGNMPLANFIGQNMSSQNQASGLPTDRPTFNLVSSAVDTLVSRITQSKPSPTFLTDNSDYKERNLAKKLSNFIQGEFYHTKTYEKAALVFRDALVEGTGCLHVYEDINNKVAVERVLLTELLTDHNESIYGEPRQLYRLKMVDRAVLIDQSPGFKSVIEKAEKAFADNGAESSKTVSDLVMVVEGWHLPSGKDAKDGRHTIACSAGIILDEQYDKETFPFIFLHYSPRMLGFWGQGLAEQLMGTQIEINALLFQISRSIKLFGVPRIFQEVGSKVAKAHHNNDIGTIIEYRGVKPSYEVANCVPQELYAQLQRLIDYGYQQCGVSALQASSTKPAGLNSGEAIRSYDDISTDRFAALAKRFDNCFIDLAYAIIDLAKDIAERDGEYSTVYPGKNGVSQVDLPDCSILKNPFVIQVFNQSSLPRDPAGRLQKVTEMIQAGILNMKEGRRLLDYPDLTQTETLANACEERIFQILDKIVEDGDYTPPDTFLDLDMANEKVVNYINLYSSAQLEEDKMQMLRDFFTQVQGLKQQAQAAIAPQPQPMQGAPQASPEPLPSSPLVPTGNPGGAM